MVAELHGILDCLLVRVDMLQKFNEPCKVRAMLMVVLWGIW